MALIARGLLRHHFWGEYHASIILAFGSAADATAAQAHAFPMFTQARADYALQFTGTGDALKDVEQLLAAHGADMDKVTSIAKSIDHGEPFTVEVAVGDGSEQLSLLGVA